MLPLIFLAKFVEIGCRYGGIGTNLYIAVTEHHKPDTQPAETKAIPQRSTPSKALCEQATSTSQGKITMKLNLKQALIATSIAAGLFGASAFAVAETTDDTKPKTEMRADRMDKGHANGKHRADRMAKMEKRMAERQAKLKAELKLAPEQESAWAAFVARTAPEPRKMGGKEGAQREDWSKLTTPERLDKMQARHAERSEAMTKRIEATKSFYASLTPEQQKTFDSKSMRGFQRTGMKGGKHGHQHGGKHMDHKKGHKSAEDMQEKQS
jgi:hypothetical protein